MLDKHINTNLSDFSQKLDKDISDLKHALASRSAFTLSQRDLYKEIEEIIVRICDFHLLGLERINSKRSLWLCLAKKVKEKINETKNT